ncbi:MAG: cysteine desulfurase [Candidatus Aureabacteria bacterium]|nr:cysteine desulfurase [Candidatus Auribacterota bacterium]
MSSLIYLDNAATTPVHPLALEKMTRQMEDQFGNPSSLHQLGMQAEQTISHCRKNLSAILSCDPSSFIFTSGATEANNWAVENAWESGKNKGHLLIAEATSHPSILAKLESMKKRGAKTALASVTSSGLIHLEELDKLLSTDVIFFSFTWVNNETGVIQPIKEILSLVRKKCPRCLIHADAVQGFVKLAEIKLIEGLDCLSISAHKIFGPKGTGAFITRKNLPLYPLIHGGGQESGKRGGTENIPGIVGFSEAAKILHREMTAHHTRALELKKLFEKMVLEKIENVLINGGENRRSPYITSLSINQLRGEVLVHALENKGVIISTGSACSSRKKTRSHVLSAMKIPDEFLDGSVRISFTPFHSQEEIETAATIFVKTVKELQHS